MPHFPCHQFSCYSSVPFSPFPTIQPHSQAVPAGQVFPSGPVRTAPPCSACAACAFEQSKTRCQHNGGVGIVSSSRSNTLCTAAAWASVGDCSTQLFRDLTKLVEITQHCRVSTLVTPTGGTVYCRTCEECLVINSSLSNSNSCPQVTKHLTAN